jgi:hypothetical protein
MSQQSKQGRIIRASSGGGALPAVPIDARTIGSSATPLTFTADNTILTYDDIVGGQIVFESATLHAGKRVTLIVQAGSGSLSSAELIRDSEKGGMLPSIPFTQHYTIPFISNGTNWSIE